ncbi:MAG TPA: class I SAM-dependent methyltransferase [Chthoniobacterales bacterium]|nr:class I SAM-dependent methyltransferase [Chthoniobacterales bacterium]
MPPQIIVATEKPLRSRSPAAARPSDSLFEHVAWVYAFCRERLFRDDTERIVATLWPNGGAQPGTQVIELGCGPGFYSANLAKRFPNISVTGVDRSANQLKWARERAETESLRNCAFVRVNVLTLPFTDAQFDVLLASRLFTVLPDCARAVAEMHRVLKSGGRCFIAEPRYALWASIPLTAMWLLARMTHSGNGYREPRKATVFSPTTFEKLFSSQPWRRVKTWHDGRYQYALCEKR